MVLKSIQKYPSFLPFRRFLAAAVAVLCLSVTAAQAQQTVMALRESGFKAFNEGEFGDAIPFFQELIQIQGESKDQQVRAALERVYYNVALCQFLTGNFDAAKVAFEAYNAKYRHGTWLHESYIYIADSLRYSNKLDEAVRQYRQALKTFSYTADMKADIYASISRCYLAQDNWDSAVEPLKKAFAFAPDHLRRNRAATLLATAYLKTMNLEEIYLMVPYLLTHDSLASRSIAFNMAALEAGDVLFGEERYREAFWLHRLVYPYDDVLVNTETYLERLRKMADNSARFTFAPRRLMRIQEWIADAEGEIKAIQENLPNYDPELLYRIARGYMESKRFREGCELFLRIHAVGGKERAEEALYFAFYCSTKFEPVSRTHTIARMYMEEYPSGEWYDVLTLIDGQLMARDKDWKAVIRHFSEVLSSHPNHQQAAECLYLLGYAHFMEEEFEQAKVRLNEIRTRFPQSDLMPEAVYWSAMASIFDGDFETGEKDFSELIEKYPECRYYQDALFRRAVCNYALGAYDVADNRLGDFIGRFPDHDLVAEATMTRGDIAGAVGRPMDAVSYYQLAMYYPTNNINIEQYNHCAFQTAEILFDAEKYQELRDHFGKYIENKRPESNLPLAVYWIGRAMIQMGELNGAIRFYRDAALRFGKNRLEVGVDMILDEWVAATRKCSKPDEKAAWDDLYYTIRNAKNAGDAVSALRFQRLNLFRPGITPSEKERELDSLCVMANVTNASPAVLETMLDAMKARGQTNNAGRVAAQIIRDFPETDYALDARAYLADVAIARASAEPAGSKRAEDLFNAAIRNLTVIREVYATSPEAAEALLKLGELYMRSGKTAEADECYKNVLGVRDWRPLWPKALFGRGLCAEKKNEWLKAAAYYERIYVMYSGYREITAKAYLARAKCLRRGYEHEKAKETLRALLASPDLQTFPEYREAESILSSLGGGK